MRKQLLKNIEMSKYPNNLEAKYIERDIYYYKPTHIYTARILTVEKEKVLEVTLFGIKEENPEYRIFFSKDKFITEDAVNNKFITASMANIDGINCFCANTGTDEIIQGFFNKKLSSKVLINEFQENVRKRKRLVKHKKVINEIDDELKTIKPVSKKFIKWLEKESMPESRYIFYSKVKQEIYGECSYCKKSVILKEGRHNTKTECPGCKKTVTLKAKGFSKKVNDSGVVSYVEKDKYNNIFIRIFDVYKCYENASIHPKFSFHEWQRYKFKEDFSWKVFCYKEYKTFEEYRWCNGTLKTQYSCGYKTEKDEFGEVYTNNLSKVLKYTYFEHFNIIEYLKSEPKTELSILFKYFMKKEFVKYLMQKKLYNLAFSKDVNKDDIAFIYSNRDRLSLFRKIDPNKDEFELIKYMIKTNKKFSTEDILKLRSRGAVKIMGILDIAGIKQISDYLYKNTSVSSYGYNSDFGL